MDIPSELIKIQILPIYI